MFLRLLLQAVNWPIPRARTKLGMRKAASGGKDGRRRGEALHELAEPDLVDKLPHGLLDRVLARRRLGRYTPCECSRSW